MVPAFFVSAFAISEAYANACKCQQMNSRSVGLENVALIKALSQVDKLMAAQRCLRTNSIKGKGRLVLEAGSIRVQLRTGKLAN
jgi:hypothetical protein